MRFGIGGILLGPFVLALTACSSLRSDLEMASSLDDPLNSPHVILIPNRETVYHGDSVEIAVTFVNPTRKSVLLPPTSRSDDGYDQIAHSLWTELNGEPVETSSFSVYSHPPYPNYLEPKSQRSYKMTWLSDYNTDGEAILKYTFHGIGAFPPASVTLATRSGERHTEPVSAGNAEKPSGVERTQ